METSSSEVFTLRMLGNPTLGLPARLVPVFKRDKTKSSFIQVSDDKGDKILKFAPVNLGAFRDLYEAEEVVRSWPGSNIVHSAKIDNGRAIIEQSRQAFRDILKRNIEDRSHFIASENPFFGLEVARYVGDANFEEFFAEHCVLRLGRQSVPVAHAWLSFAPLSFSAAEKAAAVLTQNFSPSGDETEGIPLGTDEEFPFGLSPGGRPLTYTGKVVSLGVWRAMNDDEKFGPKRSDAARRR